jgi:hypothetical protein
MKKSEMIMFIVNQFHILDDNVSGYLKDATEEELKRADVILTMIEALGMMPPAYIGFKKSRRRKTGEMYEAYGVIKNKWEPEDEAQ